MVDKVTLTNLSNLQNETTAVTAVNANNAAITTAMDNTLSRDGTSPNAMGAALDMNGYQVLNLPAPTSTTSALRFQDLNDFLGGTVSFTNLPTDGTTGQMLAKNSSTNYDASWTSAVTATTFNKVLITQPATAATLTIANNKTLTINRTLTLTGTDGTVFTFPTTSQTIPGVGQANTFTGAQSITDSTQSSSTSTGCLKLTGGLGVAKALYCDRISAANGIGVGGAVPSPSTTWISVSAGTASVAPVTLTSGTVNSTAAAGALEYDGNAFYATSVASNRALVQSVHEVVLSSDYTMSNVNTAQQAFNATAAGTVTLAGSTTYEFEALYLITNTGTTSHTWSVLFGGTATFTSLAYSIRGISNTATTPATGGLTGYSTVATAIVATAASTSATENVIISLRGVLRVNAGGTVIPEVQLSAAPGGTQKMLTNSFFRCWPVGTNTVTTVGNWS